MTRGRYTPPQPAAPFEPWKPDQCEAPGCEERHPSFSKKGSKGPWLCRKHYVEGVGLDQPPSWEQVEIEETPEDQPPPGRLL